MLKNKTEFIKKLHTVIPDTRLLLNEAMYRHTTFKIGGPADYLVLPSSAREISAVLAIAQEYHVDVTVLGNGSNVLVRDKGIRGLVMKIGKNMANIRHEGNTILAGAGALLASVARYAADQSLTGMEFAIGIPGSIGGAVYMNAGAYGGEMQHAVSAVTAFLPEGTIQTLSMKELEFSYRRSAFQQNGAVICEVELTLKQSDKEDIEAKMQEYTRCRITKQPVDLPSAGSTFKRPRGYFAGTLIEDAGLKGLSVGGAMVSKKHAGFIVNAGNATAQDVVDLISEVQGRVYDRFTVMLQPEIKIIGEE